MTDDHTYLRLEKDGVVVAYLAPNFIVQPSATNDLFYESRANGKAPILRDKLIVKSEWVLQGTFLPSTSLPAAHSAALVALFGKNPVTALDQVLRVWNYFFTVGGPYNLFWDTLQFTATTEAGINIGAGIFPQVSIAEFRPISHSGKVAQEYIFKLNSGLVRSS